MTELKTVEQFADVMAVPTALDDATIAWVNAVVASGGTVSSYRQDIVNALVLNLKAANIWDKLDGLWLFAAENSQSALCDVVYRNFATPINSPVFTSDQGYTGNGSNTYVTSNSAGWPLFDKNLACVFAWNNTLLTEQAGICGNLAGSTIKIEPQRTGTTGIYCINDGDAVPNSSFAPSGQKGLYLVNRTGQNDYTCDVNGVQQSTGNHISGISTADIVALADNSSGVIQYSARQVCVLGYGTALSSAERQTMFSSLRYYLSQVGVTL